MLRDKVPPIRLWKPPNALAVREDEQIPVQIKLNVPIIRRRIQIICEVPIDLTINLPIQRIRNLPQLVRLRANPKIVKIMPVVIALRLHPPNSAVESYNVGISIQGSFIR